MTKKYDVCAIGNALVDYEIEVDDAFFVENQIEKGLMTLVDEADQKRIIEKVQGIIKKKQAGGSAANSIFGLAQFGGKGYYTCKVANDEDGAFFIKDLVDNGIDTNLKFDNLDDGTTGKCLIMITPDADRTMNTFLGITTNISENELDYEAVKQSKYVFIEGYLVSSESAIQAVLEAKALARSNDTKVALTFSDPAMVKYFNDQVKQVMDGGIDFLVCNEEELALYTGLEGIEAGMESIKGEVKEFVITRGNKGSIVFDGTSFIEIPPFAVNAVDTTGAGDMYAGAFLYGMTNGLSHKEAGMLASAASSSVVGKYGPRLEGSQIQKVLEMIK